MSATETKEKTERPPPVIDITTREGRNTVFELLCMIKGVDPTQAQGMAKFMDPDSIDQTSFFPTQLTSIAIAQCRLFGEALYGKGEPNEYEDIANAIGEGFKGYKGWKSDQYKDITSGQPNLDKLKGLPETTQQGLLSGILGRGKE